MLNLQIFFIYIADVDVRLIPKDLAIDIILILYIFHSYLLYRNMILCAFNIFLVILRIQYLWWTDVKLNKMT